MAEEAGAGVHLDLDANVRGRVDALLEEGREIWRRFDREVRQREWHPFVPADYERALQTLLAFRAPGMRFLEWGSATGVITILADMLGFEAYGIEIDPHLVAIARDLARRYQSGARFAAASFLPSGYEWRTRQGDTRLGTIARGVSGYLELGHPLEDFDLVWGYPWSGEEPIMRDVMKRYGGANACLVLHGTDQDEYVRAGRARH